MPDPDVPPPEELQFRRAQPLAEDPSIQRCVACGQTIADQYYHAQGQVVCPLCASRIQSGQQGPPSSSLLRAAIYGAAAGLAGCALYALVAIVTGLEIGLIAIVVGIMVGKAVRHASHGLGGRPQQILAVVLTYFAITTSYIPVFIYQASKSPRGQVTQSRQAHPSQPPEVGEQPPPVSLGRALFYILALAMAAPFLQVFSSPVSGLISLFIIYIGLQRAWVLTRRPDILMAGPYKLSEA
jgi:hypothetical protein